MDKSPGWVPGIANTLQGVELLERGTYLEQLDGLLSEASSGRGRLVVVRGEAGIGKTALAEAFTAGRSKRVLWGMCDPLFPPRPLAPILDISSQVGGELTAALEDPNRHKILSAFLDTIRSGEIPKIVVLEDLQWGDEATLEVLQVAGRRASQLPAVIIATVRDEDVGPDHPLTAVIGSLPTSALETIRLPPLSPVAVKAMASDSALDSASLYQVTGGNPFFVTEMLNAGSGEVPTTVRDAILSRSRLLTPAALRVLQAAALLAPPIDAGVLCAVAQADRSDVSTSVDRGFLVFSDTRISFRHELARRAFAESMPTDQATQLHARALEVLRDQNLHTASDVLARHARWCGDVPALLEYAPLAAEQAARLGAHSTAVANYRLAVPYAGDLPPRRRAALLAAFAHECMVADKAIEAVASQEEAIRLWGEIGDVVSEAAATADLGEYLHYCGRLDEARKAPERALKLLEGQPPGEVVAHAYAKLAQTLMISGNFQSARPWASKAVTMAEECRAEAVAIHALNTLGCTQIVDGDTDGYGNLEASLRRAQAADLEEHVSRAFNNRIASARDARHFDDFDRFSKEALEFFRERDLEASEQCLIGDMVLGLFDRGRWAEAEAQARQVIGRNGIHGRGQCLLVLGRITARRGTEDPWPWLDEATEEMGKYTSQAAFVLTPARTEASWLAGDRERAVLELVKGLRAESADSVSWEIGEVALWARRLGVEYDSPRQVPDPYQFLFDGYVDKAAAFWSELGCPYDEAEMLTFSDEEDHLRRALAIFLSLEAHAAAQRVTERLKKNGAAKISRGPRAATRANPAGLSDRELEILGFVAGGLRNAEIADRLVISKRTVDHHVSAILTKLGARDRNQAGRMATELGVPPGN